MALTISLYNAGSAPPEHCPPDVLHEWYVRRCAEDADFWPKLAKVWNLAATAWVSDNAFRAPLPETAYAEHQALVAVLSAVPDDVYEHMNHDLIDAVETWTPCASSRA